MLRPFWEPCTKETEQEVSQTNSQAKLTSRLTRLCSRIGDAVQVIVRAKIYLKTLFMVLQFVPLYQLNWDFHLFQFILDEMFGL